MTAASMQQGITVPSRPLRKVFTPEALQRLWAVASRSDALRHRLDVLTASGPYPSDPADAHHLRYLRAKKAAWETYLEAAFACGLFKGARGADLRARLTSVDNDGFRSAMAECETCWFLAGKMKLTVLPSLAGRGSRCLDLGIRLPEGEAGVEVKAPFREAPKPPPGEVCVTWCGDDADVLQQCMDTANKQFSDCRPNILVIVPNLRTPLYDARHQLIRAFYGEEKITKLIDTRTGGPVGPTKMEFFPEGKFLGIKRPGGRLIKPNGMPGFTRVNAVISIEERFVERYPPPDPLLLLDEERLGEIWPYWQKARSLHFSSANSVWVDHNVLVLHNPMAKHAIDSRAWRGCVQFIDTNGVMAWTDGHGLHP